ncbi:MULTISPECIES: hypothetical protein [unclassified Sinorhizobium]|uniref:hypothetical protein n=1 Tax=unclassified Sinorhizobium TaxID=2613772 RepID=UPI0024C40881|nr:MULTISPECIES: hypothetical protein [unclassified Sinorhizobium]MDK1378201.1 hypothetical protein [Sinorhizobium sp. 6-70]MDK1482727.1 hypothetical protein [Sinorhizobium sp. 6-117]
MIDSTSQPYTSAIQIGNLLPRGLPLSATMMVILMERYDINEKQIRAEHDDMQMRNNLLKDMNAALAELRKNRPADEHAIVWYGEFVDFQGITHDVHQWMLDNGIPIEQIKNDNAGVQSEFDAAINNLKAAIDSANSEGQMALIRLQGLLDKLNQVLELMSNLLSKDYKTKETVIANTR